jgi:hypothetical protein
MESTKPTSNEAENGNKSKPLLADSRSLDFHHWLYKACEIKGGKLKEAHDIFPYVDLTDAKLSFIDGMTELEYSKFISTM